MFSGAKHKLQRWRQRKRKDQTSNHDIQGLNSYISKGIMENPSIKDYQSKNKNIINQLKFLQNECCSIIDQMKIQFDSLSKIGEDTTVLVEKIDELTSIARNISQELEKAEMLTSIFECVETLLTAINKSNTEIEELKQKAASLERENRSIRTELLVFIDHRERADEKIGELEVQIEHLKFMSTLPSECQPAFEREIEKDDEEKFVTKPNIAIPFIEDDISKAASYILSVLDTLDFTDHNKLKILFGLIKGYIQNEKYDIAIPLLKTTLEDLLSQYSPQDEIVFKMMEIMVMVYNLTQRFKDAIELQKQILDIRKESMPNDKIGLGQTLSRLTLLYGKIGKVKTARIFCRQALDLKFQVYGDKNLETAKELHNMGVLYLADEKYSQAVASLKTALTMMKQSSKRNVFCLAEAGANLATALMKNDELVEAKYVFKVTLKFMSKELDKMLEGKQLPKDILISDENKIEEISDCENKDEIIKIVRLLVELKESSHAVSHIKQEDVAAEYKLFSDEE